MKKHTCNLCSRSFPSGRAVGGHMSSHVTKPDSSYSSSSSSSSPSGAADVDCKVGPLAYAPRENLKKSICLLSDPDFRSSTVVQDDESGPEADVAISLMMLSRDTWPAPGSGERSETVRIRPANGRSKYQCRTCRRVFKSYQALGGHRASRKKNNGCRPAKGDPTRIAAEDAEACYRVFSLGQALREHTTSQLVVNDKNNNHDDNYDLIGNGNRKSFIDLNLPAPIADDAELSVVSDAEFVIGIGKSSITNS